MGKVRLGRPTPGTVLATVAVVAAMGGTATAATVITGAQIKDGSVSGRDVKDGSLTSRDMNKGMRELMARMNGHKHSDPEPGEKGDKGDRGEKGDRGDAGERGATGAKGDSTPQVVRSAPGEAATFSKDDVIAVTGTGAAEATSIADVQFVEPGLWNITAKIGVESRSPDDVILCEMSTAGNAATRGAEQQTGFNPGAVLDTGPASNTRGFELQSVFVMLEPQVVHLDCYDAFPNGGVDDPADVTAAGLVAEKNGKVTPLVEAG